MRYLFVVCLLFLQTQAALIVYAVLYEPIVLWLKIILLTGFFVAFLLFGYLIYILGWLGGRRSLLSEQPQIPLILMNLNDGFVYRKVGKQKSIFWVIHKN